MTCTTSTGIKTFTNQLLSYQWPHIVNKNTYYQMLHHDKSSYKNNKTFITFYIPKFTYNLFFFPLNSVYILIQGKVTVGKMLPLWGRGSLEKTLMLGKIENRRWRGRQKIGMVGWYHWLRGHEFEQTPGDSEGQRSLICCSSWGCKESDTT